MSHLRVWRMCMAWNRLWPATAKLTFMFCHIVWPNTAEVTQIRICSLVGTLVGTLYITSIISLFVCMYIVYCTCAYVYIAVVHTVTILLLSQEAHQPYFLEMSPHLEIPPPSKCCHMFLSTRPINAALKISLRHTYRIAGNIGSN